MDRIDAGLKLLELAVDGDGLERVLHPIEEAIRASFLRMEDADDGSEFADIVEEEEADVVENLLGAAFVVCQARIAKITTRFVRLETACGAPLPGGPHKKHTVVRRQSPTVGATTYTTVELINHVANYYKHHSEWHRPWSAIADPMTKRTRDAVISLGADEAAIGNMRRLTRELTGDDDLSNLEPLVEAVVTWGHRLRDEIAAHLGR